MTKYLLNSGGIGNSADKGQRFFRAVVENLGENPKVLFCFFALPREDWEAKYAEYVAGFTSHMTENVHPKFLAHYESEFGADDPRGPIDWHAAKEELEAYHDKKLPVYALREGEFEILEA